MLAIQCKYGDHPYVLKDLFDMSARIVKSLVNWSTTYNAVQLDVSIDCYLFLSPSEIPASANRWY